MGLLIAPWRLGFEVIPSIAFSFSSWPHPTKLTCAENDHQQRTTPSPPGPQKAVHSFYGWLHVEYVLVQLQFSSPSLPLRLYPNSGRRPARSVISPQRLEFCLFRDCHHYRAIPAYIRNCRMSIAFGEIFWHKPQPWAAQQP